MNHAYNDTNIGALSIGKFLLGPFTLETISKGALPIGAFSIGALAIGTFPSGALPCGVIPSRSLPSRAFLSRALWDLNKIKVGHEIQKEPGFFESWLFLENLGPSEARVPGMGLPILPSTQPGGLAPALILGAIR